MTTNKTNDDRALRLAPIEPEEYDALADLFLGESALAPERATVQNPDAGWASSGHEVAVVVDDELYDDESAVDLPCPPDRYVECKPMEYVECVESTTPEPIAPLAPVQVIGRISPEEMEPEDRIEQVDEVVERPAVEVVLLGHLPVRATLWVRQYACAVARETGETVALIRAASGSTAVDLISGSKPIETKEAVSIAHALEKAAHLADRVILRVDEAAEPELLERSEIDRVTILTGADETAVVASYRLIKTMTASWDWTDDNSPMLRMAVMGGTAEQSSDARAKLTRAVESFLDHPIEIVISAGRIDATGTMNLFRDDVAHPASHILDALFDCDAEEVAAEVLSPIDMLREDIDALETLEALTKQVRSNPVERAVCQERKPMPSEREVCQAGVHTLSGLIAGLSALETRCPSAPGVELAVDEHGRIHMVTDDSRIGALSRLMNASAWVHDHLQLLLRVEDSLVMPSVDPRADSEPTMHLLAEEPRALMAVYPTSVRVYALATVQVGDAVARVATAIN